ncbi:unnamed protein product [Leptidea sinapis]|uniref:Uncharacterized protein n=1 Tax=Leptidea sinapis TaxID=189913 RepID=A0A5E4Q316_9NEOP|nr:unnamed protein product [Leptidea sinapis]
MIRPVRIQIPLKMFLYGYFVIVAMIFHDAHQTEFIGHGTAVGQDTNSESKVQQYFYELLGVTEKKPIQKNNPYHAFGPAIRAGLNRTHGHDQGCKEGRCFFFGNCGGSFIFGKRRGC